MLFNKRESKRAKISLNAMFKIVSGDDAENKSSATDCLVTDLTLKGLCFEAGMVQIDRMHIFFDGSSLVKNFLEIDLQLPHKKKDTPHNRITFMGGVIWYDRKDSNPKYPFYIGVEIVEISENDRLKIKSFLGDL